MSGQNRQSPGPRSLAILVVNYGSHDLLVRNLVPLARSLPDAHVVVFDNFKSTDDTSMVTDLAGEQGWTVLESASNIGFGAGMNRAAGRAMSDGAEQLLLLNPDAQVAPDVVESLSVALSDGVPKIVVPRMLDARGRPRASSFFVRLADGSMEQGMPSIDGIVSARPGYLPWLGAACLMMGSKTWQMIGGFREEYFLYWEDVDLGIRANDCGVQLQVIGDLTFTHDQGATQLDDAELARDAKSEAYYYYNIRNRLLFAALNLTEEQQNDWLRSSWRASYQVLRRGGRRQFARPWPLIRVVTRGLQDGRSLVRSAQQ